MGSKSGIRDNRQRGSVGEFLAQNITVNSRLSFVSAYFTIYAYQAMMAVGHDAALVEKNEASANRTTKREYRK